MTPGDIGEFTQGEIARSFVRLETGQNKILEMLDGLTKEFVGRAEWDVRLKVVDQRLESIESRLNSAGSRGAQYISTVVAAIALVVAFATKAV